MSSPHHAVAAVTRAQTRANYDRISGVYDLLSAWSERPARERGLQALAVRDGETVLELGTGTGLCLEALATAAGPRGRVVGVDLSQGMLQVARGRLEALHLTGGVGLLCADATALPLASATVDAVFTTFTLELFSDEEAPRVLAECARVLREGGRLGVVSLSRTGAATWTRRAYEWSHRVFPSVVDCQPIDVAGTVRRAGYEALHVDALSMFGLRVEVVVGTRGPGAGG